MLEDVRLRVALRSAPKLLSMSLAHPAPARGIERAGFLEAEPAMRSFALQKLPRRRTTKIAFQLIEDFSSSNLRPSRYNKRGCRGAKIECGAYIEIGGRSSRPLSMRKIASARPPLKVGDMTTASEGAGSAQPTVRKNVRKSAFCSFSPQILTVKYLIYLVGVHRIELWTR